MLQCSARAPWFIIINQSAPVMVVDCVVYIKYRRACRVQRLDCVVVKYKDEVLTSYNSQKESRQWTRFLKEWLYLVSRCAWPGLAWAYDWNFALQLLCTDIILRRGWAILALAWSV